MNVTEELEREIEEEAEEVVELPTFALEGLPAPKRQMSIYGLVEKGLHEDAEPRG